MTMEHMTPPPGLMAALLRPVQLTKNSQAGGDKHPDFNIV
jgi:hypothetical protein